MIPRSRMDTRPIRADIRRRFRLALARVEKRLAEEQQRLAALDVEEPTRSRWAFSRRTRELARQSPDELAHQRDQAEIASWITAIRLPREEEPW